ncbi:MAG: prepilin-type N-terminal cleavage/methylation domain-containing protein [Candidatus Nitrospinota bacterium M3_3B_026]
MVVTRRGCTLVELVVVLLVLSILAIAAWPAVSGPRQISINAAAEVLKTDINRTRLLAMTKGAPRRITLNEGAAYYVYGEGEVDSGRRRGLAGLAPGISIRKGGTVSFNSLGEPSGGSLTFELALAGESVSVAIEPYTGRVSVR